MYELIRERSEKSPSSFQFQCNEKNLQLEIEALCMRETDWVEREVSALFLHPLI